MLRFSPLFSQDGAPEAAVVPTAFAVGQWSLTWEDDVPKIVINALPENGGSAITQIQERVNGGVPRNLGGAAIGTYDSVALIGQTVEVRAVNAIGAGLWSDVKVVAEQPQTAPTVLGATSFTGRRLTATVVELTGNPEPTLSQVAVALTVRTNPAQMTLVEPGTWIFDFPSDDEDTAWSVLLTVDTGVAPAGTWSAAGIVPADIVGVPLVLERASDDTLRGEGSGPFTIAIGSPAPYVGGPFTTDLSEEGAAGLIEFEAAQIAPQCVILPAMVRTTGAADDIGAVYTYVPGVWAYGEAFTATDAVTWDVFRDGVALGLSNPATYEATADGVHEFRETITGAGATRTARSNLVGVGAAIDYADTDPVLVEFQPVTNGDTVGDAFPAGVEATGNYQSSAGTIVSVTRESNLNGREWVSE